MKIGLIARCEIARGLAIQSKNFYDHIPVEKVLLIRMPRPDCVEAPDWYDNATNVAFDNRAHQLDEQTVRRWLKGLDVVFSIETVYDWRIPIWCRKAGVKLVVQGNPEFVKHGQPRFEHLPHPDQWWWPTSWRLQHLPEGPVMPVPLNPREMPEPDPERFRVLHVVGKRAYQDRNGTDILAQAMRSVRGRVTLTAHGIDGQLPEFRRIPNVEYRINPDLVEDRWAMYENQHLLILPRKYGGLCLPALEATACGMAVAMPDISPNEELAAIRTPIGRMRSYILGCGRVDAVESNAMQIAEVLSRLAANREQVQQARIEQRKLLPTWDVWRDRYLKAFKDVL